MSMTPLIVFAALFASVWCQTSNLTNVDMIQDFISTMVCKGINAPGTEEVFGPDPCTWGYVGCTGHPPSITQLTISYMECTGYVDLTKPLPGTLQKLFLHENNLAGTLDLTQLGKNLTQIYLHGNQFYGTVNLTALPPKLLQLRLDQNMLGGPLDMSKIPTTVKNNPAGLNISNNPGWCGSTTIRTCTRLSFPSYCGCNQTQTLKAQFNCPMCTPIPPGVTLAPTPVPQVCTTPRFPPYTIYNGEQTSYLGSRCWNLCETCRFMFEDMMAAVTSERCVCDSCPTSISSWKVRQRYVNVRAACDRVINELCPQITTAPETPEPDPSPPSTPSP